MRALWYRLRMAFGLPAGARRLEAPLGNRRLP